MMMDLTLQLLKGRFALCRLPAGTPPAKAGQWCFWGITPEETSLVCREEDVPPQAQKAELGYVCVRVAGTLDLSLIGILARITRVLAEVQVPVFAVSTYDTDYLLVHAVRWPDARRALLADGMVVGEI